MVLPLVSKVPPLDPNVMPRLLLKEMLLVALMPPPLRVIWSAVKLPGAVPKMLSPLPAIKPPLMLVLPV
jgi:hypothetical protein